MYCFPNTGRQCQYKLRQTQTFAENETSILSDNDHIIGFFFLNYFINYNHMEYVHAVHFHCKQLLAQR